MYVQYKTYESLENDIDEYYKEKKIEQIIKLIKQNLPNFPNHEYQLIHMLGFFLTMEKRFQEAIAIWKTAIDQNYFFGFSKTSEFYQPYFKIPAFLEIFEKNQKILQKVQKKTTVQYDVQTPKNYDPNQAYPLFIALHGGSDNKENAKTHWMSDLLNEKFIVAYLQSSQVAGMDVFAWNDLEKGKNDVRKCFKEITKNYLIDITKSVIGGISAGGKMSIKMVLDENFPVKHFIGMVPVKYDAFDQELERCSKKIKGVIIAGLQDTRYYPQQKYLIKKFEDARIPLETIKYENLGHSYSPNFSQDLDRALHFLLTF